MRGAIPASGSDAGSTTLTFCGIGTAEFRLWEKTGEAPRALRISSGVLPVMKTSCHCLA